MSDLAFRKMFRMKRSSFDELYLAIESLLYTPNNYWHGDHQVVVFPNRQSFIAL
jgi:hypothetical protein